MTPKEKAKELFSKGMSIRWDIPPDEAKTIAMITIDEIISFIPYETYKDALHPYDGAELSTNYWNEVKLEIEKI